MVMVFSFSARSAQAEERQDEHDDYDQTDEINDAIHGCLLKAGIAALLRCKPASAEPGQTGESSVRLTSSVRKQGAGFAVPARQPKISPAEAGLIAF
jgi:hypothetical protein